MLKFNNHETKSTTDKRSARSSKLLIRVGRKMRYEIKKKRENSGKLGGKECGKH